MNRRFVYFKRLTATEVGERGTHEIYVRLPNDFDYDVFFLSELTDNNGVLEKVFEAKNLTKGHEADSMVSLRFAYFHKSNKEKRIPSLGGLFDANNVEENDVVRLESRDVDGDVSFYITFFKSNEITLSSSQFSYVIDNEQENIIENKKIKSTKSEPLQQIYYGAPGTGKSYKVNEITEGKSFVRTTFHPDSDYSTFVGAYKPTTKQKKIFVREESHGKSDDQVHTEDRIVYEFVAQAFLKAYVDAWTLYVNAKKEREEPKPQYLVIEEINRGNCAQIFGDLFQLLDRNDSGFSQYYIVADSDINNYLRTQMIKLELSDWDKKSINCFYNKKNVAESEWDDVASKILSGEVLVLPSNFCILATMNTSDQSLFPIDSAFKRRWDWVYIPIANHSEKKWNIVVGKYTCGWYSFLEKINEQIGATTNSEDKKLGFFFCQADSNDVIDANKFVGKVLFYLWNDVFKDYGFEDEIFKIKGIDNLTFDKFYTGYDSVNIDVASRWLQKLMTGKEEEEKPTSDNSETSTLEQPQEQ